MERTYCDLKMWRYLYNKILIMRYVDYGKGRSAQDHRPVAIERDLG